MRIRRATAADAPALVALNQSVQELHARALPDRFRSNVPAETMERAFAEMILAPSAFWLVADAADDGENGQPIAFLSAEFRERVETWCAVAQRVCYLSGIAVAPQFRRRGIARALLTELQREATARGASCIDLDVWAFNAAARQAFERLGFCGVMERMTLRAEAQ